MFIAYHPETGLTLHRISESEQLSHDNAVWKRIGVRPFEFETAAQAIAEGKKLLLPGMSKRLVAENNTVRKSV